MDKVNPCAVKMTCVMETNVAEASITLARRLADTRVLAAAQGDYAMMGIDEVTGFLYIIVTGMGCTDERFSKYLQDFETFINNEALTGPQGGRCMLIDTTRVDKAAIPSLPQLLAKASLLFRLRPQLTQHIKESVFLTGSDQARDVLTWLLRMAPPQNPYSVLSVENLQHGHA
jgi:hypothetical protein